MFASDGVATAASAIATPAIVPTSTPTWCPAAPAAATVVATPTIRLLLPRRRAALQVGLLATDSSLFLSNS